MISSLLARVVNRLAHGDGEVLTFTLYTRRECGCCHKALGVLKGHQRRHRFRVEEVDVDSDPALAEKYGLSVPVVTLGGKVRFTGQVNPVLLKRLLDAESRGD